MESVAVVPATILRLKTTSRDGQFHFVPKIRRVIVAAIKKRLATAFKRHEKRRILTPDQAGNEIPGTASGWYLSVRRDASAAGCQRFIRGLTTDGSQIQNEGALVVVVF